MGQGMAVSVPGQSHDSRQNRMRILLTGALGFIGSAIAARLTVLQHDVIAVAHQSRTPSFIGGRHVQRDVTRLPKDEWLELLAGVDAVINCVGALQDAPGTSVESLHHTGLRSLFEACSEAGVMRVIHFSAIGVDRATPSRFSSSKLAGDAALMQSRLDWIILRPSVVVGQAAFGGSALFRGAAALPFIPRLPQTGPLQIVQLDDVVDTVIFFLDQQSPSKCALEICGPQALSFY